jgi:predicted nucleic acid-binding protein
MVADTVDEACLYFDSSALVKLVREEPRSDEAVAAWRTPGVVRVSSELAFAEVLRAFRFSPPQDRRAASAVLDRMALVAVDKPILTKAAKLGPDVVRTLDAIHIATALSIGASLQGVVTMDNRMADAAVACGLMLFAPA